MAYTIDDLKVSLKGLVEKFTEAPLKFVDAKLQDGSIVRVEADQFQVGQPVFVVDENGQAPLMDGKYVLETGEMLVVEGGLIKEFTPKTEEAPQEEMNDAAQTSTPSAVAQPKRYIERVEKEHIFEHVKEICKEDFEKINEKFEAIKAENESLKSEIAKSKSIVDSVLSLVEKFANAPSEPTSVIKKDEFKAKEKSVFMPSIESIDEFRKKFLQ